MHIMLGVKRISMPKRRHTKLFFVPILLGIVFLISCENDFVLSYNVPSKPVIYAIIDPQDTIHYLKVGRTFSGSGNALISAQNADSITYKKVSPRLEFYTEKGWMYKELTFTPEENSSKNDGIFSKEGLQIFQLKADIQNLFIDGSYLVLNMEYSDTNYITSQITYTIPPRIVAPKQGNNSLFEFYSPYSFSVKFEDPAEFAKYQVHFRLYYINLHNNGDESRHYVDKVFYRNSNNETKHRTSYISIPIDGDNLFAQYAKVIPIDKSVKFRRFDHIDIILMTGSPVFYENLDLQQMSDDYGGSTISNIINGYGVFSLKHQTNLTGIKLGSLTLDSLVKGRFTRELGFIYY